MEGSVAGLDAGTAYEAGTTTSLAVVDLIGDAATGAVSELATTQTAAKTVPARMAPKRLHPLAAPLPRTRPPFDKSLLMRHEVGQLRVSWSFVS
jgi:hypothetical protein